MDNQPEIVEPSPELREFIEMTTRALMKAGQEARRVAEMTGTPLVVRKTDSFQPPDPVLLRNG